MKKNEIQVGGHYKAKVSGRITTVKVEDISEESVRAGYNRDSRRTSTRYHVINLATGRKTTFRSAQKFIQPVVTEAEYAAVGMGEAESVLTPLAGKTFTTSHPQQEPAMPSLADKLKVDQPKEFPPHLIIEALAGTGKTTTLVEGLKLVMGMEPRITPSPQQQAVWDELKKSKGATSVLFVAFNKSIATELQRRVPTGCAAMTMHSMGLKAVTNAFGRVTVNEYRVSDIIASIMGKDLRDLRRDDFELVKGTEKLVSLCKMNLIGTDTQDHAGDWFDTEGFDGALDQLCSHYEVELNGSKERVYKLVPQVLERCKDVNRDRMMDFNDMIWLPVALGLSVQRYDLLLVDEAQDLNRCQQELAKKAGKRIVMCGDKHQAIYGFAGADSESMNRMEKELAATEQGCTVLPLTVTRRCGKAIVMEARQFVPEFEAHESNCAGLISKAGYGAQKSPEVGASKGTPVGELAIHPGASYHSMVQDGDMCLCRVNAPLVSQCFRFLKAGRKANIQGRDIGQGLISTVKKMKAADVPELVQKLSDWVHAETEKENRKRFPNDARMIALQDRYDCLICFTEGMTTVEAVTQRIEAIFTDNREAAGIKLSTIHKAKGLEAHRVFLLEPEGATVPHPMAKSAWQKEQEWNLRYVAITRAIEELVYVK